MTIHPFSGPAVKAVFDGYPQPMRMALLSLRALILETADRTEGVGPLTETLKWRQPAYLPERTGVGTTLRIDARRDDPKAYSMFFHCQSRLGDEFRSAYPEVFRFEGDRALIFAVGEQVPAAELSHCIAMALTYHRRRRA
jgi:hypothetical protein